MIFKKHYLSKKQKNKKKVLENKNIPAFSENSSWNTFLDFFSFFFSVTFYFSSSWKPTNHVQHNHGLHFQIISSTKISVNFPPQVSC